MIEELLREKGVVVEHLNYDSVGEEVFKGLMESMRDAILNGRVVNLHRLASFTPYTRTEVCKKRKVKQPWVHVELSRTLKDDLKKQRKRA